MTGNAMLSVQPAIDDARTRAAADYLAVSRSPHLYASPGAYEQAELQAWERLMNTVDPRYAQPTE